MPNGGLYNAKPCLFLSRRCNTESPPEKSDTLSLEEKIAQIVAEVPEEEWAKLPPDLGDHLDHYVYGTPKRK
jgi:hypothetical protein